MGVLVRAVVYVSLFASLVFDQCAGAPPPALLAAGLASLALRSG
jgi:hypothetical protein